MNVTLDDLLERKGILIIRMRECRRELERVNEQIGDYLEMRVDERRNKRFRTGGYYGGGTAIR